MSCKISLQLFTLMKEIKEDFIGTLGKVAEMGYQGVEFGGYTGDFTPKELKRHLDRLGLKTSGMHISMDCTKNEIEQAIAFAQGLDCSYLILQGAKYTTKAEYLELAEVCQEAGKKCKQQGITFCFHNHHREFIRLNGKFALDLLFERCSQEYVQAEIDVYWVKYAGVDPVEYIEKFKDRCPLLHIKDMEDNENGDFAEIGNGIIDIKGIAEIAAEIGTEWLVVEQDRCKLPPLESVAISAENLKKMKLL